MSIPKSKYFPDGYLEKNEKLSKSNDELEAKFVKRMEHWNSIYQGISNKIIKIDYKNLKQISDLVELEASILTIHESARIEYSKLVAKLRKIMDSIEKEEIDLRIFYEVRKNELNITLKRDYELIIESLLKERERTSKLYQSLIDYLDELKELLVTLKYKINQTNRIGNNDI
jgi:hypothetical protein